MKMSVNAWILLSGSNSERDHSDFPFCYKDKYMYTLADTFLGYIQWHSTVSEGYIIHMRAHEENTFKPMSLCGSAAG